MYATFNVIDIVNDTSPYPTLLGIYWAMENLTVINLKKMIIKFENHDMRVIAPLDPLEGKRYVETIKDEAMGGWDNAYNLSKDYINTIYNGDFGW